MNEQNQAAESQTSDAKKTLLVVTSKIKAYCKAKGMSAGKEAMESLTALVERECDRAMEAAKADGRKTMKVRDFG